MHASDCDTKKVLFISRFNTFCGISTYTENLAKELHTHGHQVSVLASQHHPVGGTVRRDIDHDVLSRIVWDEDGDLSECLDAVIEAQPGIVHIQHEFGIFRGKNSVARFCSRIREMFWGRVKTIITLHTVPKVINQQFLDMIKEADGLIVHSKAAENQLYRCKSLINLPKARTIEHGMLSPQRKMALAAAREKLELPLKKGCKVLLTLGFISAQKKHMIVLQCIDHLVRNRRLQPQQIVVIVAGMAQPANDVVPLLRRYANQTAWKHGLFIFDRYIGMDELPTMYGAADATIHIRGPSALSSSGSLRLDLSYGMPAIVTRAEITEDIPSSVVAFVKGEHDLPLKIEELLKDDTLRRRLSMAAYDYAESCSWPNVTRKHSTFYGQVTS